MSLTKTEQIALRIFAKTCQKKNECVEVLRAIPHPIFCPFGEINGKCYFDGSCLNCFLRGEIHRLKTRKSNIIHCGEELHDYFSHNKELSEEYPLAGLRCEDVEKAVAMLKAIRGGMEPGLVVEEFL